MGLILPRRSGLQRLQRRAPIMSGGGAAPAGGLTISGVGWTATGSGENARNVPTETLTGDLLICFVMSHWNNPVTEGTGNWRYDYEIDFATLMRTEVWTYIATQDGNHVDNQPSLSGHSNGSFSTIVSVPGASQTYDVAPIGGHDGVTDGYPYTGAKSFTFPGVTAITDGSLVIACYNQDNDYTDIVPTEWDGDGSWQFIADNSSAQGTDGMQSIGQWQMSTAASTDDPTNIIGGWASYRKEVITLVVKPA